MDLILYNWKTIRTSPKKSMCSQKCARPGRLGGSLMCPMCTSIAAAALSVLGSETRSTCSKRFHGGPKYLWRHLKSILELKPAVVPVVLRRLGDVRKALLHSRHTRQLKCQSLKSGCLILIVSFPFVLLQEPVKDIIIWKPCF